jgi:hypothetical protein
MLMKNQLPLRPFPPTSLLPLFVISLLVWISSTAAADTITLVDGLTT